MTSNTETWMKDIPLTLEEYYKTSDNLTKERRWFFIGKYCGTAKHNRKNGETIWELSCN